MQRRAELIALPAVRSTKSSDLQYHFQQAVRAHHANKYILEDRRVRISRPLRYFVFFFLAPFFRKVSVLDCCTGQSPGNEMTVLLVSLQATRGGVAKSKPCSLRGGWGLAGGRAHVACGRGFRCVVGGSHPRCCGRTCPRITSLLQGR